MSIAPNRVKLILFVLGVPAAMAVFALAVYGLMARAHFAAGRSIAALSTGRGSGVPASAGVISGIAKRPDGSAVVTRLTLVGINDGSRPAPGRGRGYGGGRGPMSVTSDAGGQFQVPFVAAGKYWLVAHAEVVAEAPALPTHYWGLREVSSDGRGQVDAPIRLQLGGTITGRLSLRTTGLTARPDFSAAVLTLNPADPSTIAQATGWSPYVTPDAEGTFVIPGVPPGRYTLQASLGAPWSIDVAEIGGRDAIDLPVEITSRAASIRASIVLTDRPNEITGVVQMAPGRPAPLALVVAFSADASTRGSIRRSKAVRSSLEGKFQFTGLPAGEYLVAAAGDLPVEDWYSTAGMARLAAQAVRVTMGGGARQSVTLLVR